MKKLTKEQYDNVMKAIDLAEKAGACKYVIDDKPCCVIAQLYVLEGKDISCLAEVSDRVGCLFFQANYYSLHEYEAKFLNELQCMWDKPLSTLQTEDAVKQNMKTFVDGWQKLAELSE